MTQITTDPLLRLAVLATGLVVLLGLPLWWNEAVAEETDSSVSSVLTTYADCIDKVNDLRRSAQEAHAQGIELMRAAYAAVNASSGFDTEFWEVFHEASEYFRKAAEANAKAMSISCHLDKHLSDEQKFDFLSRINDKMKNNMITDPVASYFVSGSLDLLSKSGKQTFDLIGKLDRSVNSSQILDMNNNVALGNGVAGSHSLGVSHSLGTSNNYIGLGNGDHVGAHSLGDSRSLGTSNNDLSLGNSDTGGHSLGESHSLGTSNNDLSLGNGGGAGSHSLGGVSHSLGSLNNDLGLGNGGGAGGHSLGGDSHSLGPSKDSGFSPALGVSQDLGNTPSLGKYSSMVQADEGAAAQAPKETQASIAPVPVEGSRPISAQSPTKETLVQACVKLRSVYWQRCKSVCGAGRLYLHDCVYILKTGHT
jgi:hypothetical protein